MFPIPEVGDQVMVGFESGTAEKPFVMGTHYNGSGLHPTANIFNKIFINFPKHSISGAL